MARRVGIDREPLLVRFLAFLRVDRDVVRGIVVSSDPALRQRNTSDRMRRMNSNRDHLRGHARVGLLVWVGLVVVGAVGVVIELVGQVQLVIVAEAVEGAHRVGVIGPAFVSRDVTLHGPRRTAVEGLVEAEQVVVALGADDPLHGSD